LDGQRPIVELKGVDKSFGPKSVLRGLDLTVRDHEFLTLLGPSGCGKTTVLRLVAGFEDPDSGEVWIDGVRMDHLPPQHRNVNTVFQSYALFPHMTVFQNVAFGPVMKNTPPAEVRERVAETLRIVRMEELADRKPHQLSGGQQQRVAIARALINRPRVLLLDEPLNALDYKLRKEMQVELKQIQRSMGITFLFVTHDQEEALSMSDRVAVMRDGRIEQEGTPREVYEKPANLFVAGFVGETNILDARVRVRIDDATVEARICGQDLALRDEGRFSPGDRVKVVLRPEDMRIHDLKDDGLPGRHFLGRVVEREYKGVTLDSVILLEDDTRVLASEFFDEDDPSFDYAIGQTVAVSWVTGWEVLLPDEPLLP
jgi:spermidine/putrescine transport system ATP-binding protein